MKEVYTTCYVCLKPEKFTSSCNLKKKKKREIKDNMGHSKKHLLMCFCLSFILRINNVLLSNEVHSGSFHLFQGIKVNDVFTTRFHIFSWWLDFMVKSKYLWPCPQHSILYEEWISGYSFPKKQILKGSWNVKSCHKFLVVSKIRCNIRQTQILKNKIKNMDIFFIHKNNSNIL